MKKKPNGFIIALFMFLFSNLCHSQILDQPIPNSKKTYQSYICKNGEKISVGDTLTIGMPSTDHGFKFITQGGQRAADFLAGKQVDITKIRTYKGRFSGAAYLEFKGFGLAPVSINYENALRAGEIEPPAE